MDLPSGYLITFFHTIMNKPRPIRVHFENDPGLDDIFDVSRERIKAALKRNPEAAEVIRMSFGNGDGNFEKRVTDAEVLFAWRFPHRKIASLAPALKWIHVHGAGVEHLRPFDSWLPSGAKLTNSRGVHGDRANEYFLMTLLMLNNYIPAMSFNARSRKWVQRFNTSIIGKTVLIVGVGHMGGGAASWSKKVGLKVIGIRRTGKPHRHVDEMHTPDMLYKLLPRADFVFLSTPLTSKTEMLIGRKEIRAMKPGAGLVNVGRAGVLDHDALGDALRSGHLSGAVLDVMPQEPLPSRSPLWNIPNLFITTHSSSDDAGYYTPRSLDLFLQNLVRYARGRKLNNLVDLEQEY
jgi:phosphoglycerate dehydrogenase-like enzyme